MIIWIVAILLLAFLGWIGFQQGAIRAAVSFIGLVIAAAVAVPLSSVMLPLFRAVGMKHPAAQYVLGPAIAFLLVWVVFQIVAQAVNQKVEVFYKYKRDDKSRMKMERLNDRLGIFVGLLTGTALFILTMIPIYLFGYLTVQLASGEEDVGSLRFINKAREELRATKFDQVVAGYDPAKKELYDAFDIAGMVYKNPVSVSRLARYPSFLTLAEREEFQALARDTDFHNLWQSGATIGDLAGHPMVQSITTNAALMNDIQAVLIPDLKDLKHFLETGESEKYGDERILGRWQFDFAATVNLERKNRPTISANELRQLRAKIVPFWGVSLIATIENKVLLKRGEKTPGAENAPELMAEGTWQRESGLYKISIDNRNLEAVVEDKNKLILQWGDVNLLFIRELQ